MRRVYLDNNATTRLDAEVLDVMMPYLQESYGNPSSLHWLGDEAAKALAESRERVARTLNCYSSEVYFTSGGTESDNIAITGCALSGKDRKRIITSAVEHSAVLDTCYALQERGWELTVLPVDRGGLVNPHDLEMVIDDDVLLVSIMTANNVIGTIQPIEELAAIAHEHGAIFHTDAVQGYCHIPIDVQAMDVDMLSVSAHKIHGPKGVGALYVRDGTPLSPIMYGGGQEGGIRPSTENVPGIVGLGKAAELAYENMGDRERRIALLRDRIIDGLLEVEGIHLNGHRSPRLANNAHFRIDGVIGTDLVLALSDRGIAASTASACSASSPSPSHVLMAIGLTWEQAESSLRLGLSHHTTSEDVDYVLEMIPSTVRMLREAKRFNLSKA
ncbi:MAG: cysteine desulfurase [Candidatus Methanomethylophilaceae archaeon]|nr:cysteine desulfurase [Candidatus Methanomethylophilaceae archaeon]MDI3541900.1 cysteine desulfurase [Candidatus Methanomethylophilaceae archaeon]HIJ00588.1 cysteine desulfurase [Candidatus Methanomethylophilaceae archaeon]